METFASLRDYKGIRLVENKDRFIQKNTLLTDEQKKEVLGFFHSHANLEAKVNNGNWNFNIPYEEFKRVMDSVDTQAKRLKKQTKELRKQTGLEGLVEGTDYVIIKETSEYIAYEPLTHKAMRVIASNMVEPKLWCESSVMDWTPKEILPEREPMKGDLYPGAKWCVAMETDEHWESYTNKGCKFVVVCSKNPKVEETLKKICLVYKAWDISIGSSVTASDVPLKDVQSDYIDTVIDDLDTILQGENSIFTLEEIQKFYHSESEVYRLSSKIISPQDLLKIGKLDHPVIWKGDFIIKNGIIRSLEGCPDIVTGDFNCSTQTGLTSLEGAPKYVGEDFCCTDCNSLTSLEGAPREVGGDFFCSFCSRLKSLKGAPRKVGGDFNCVECQSLTSLEGAPEHVGGDFYCNDCESLTSLEDAPEYVKGNFYCARCPNL